VPDALRAQANGVVGVDRASTRDRDETHDRASVVGRASTIDRIGLQLYTVRREMAVDVPATIEKVARAGYREVEFAGYFNQDLVKLRTLLDHWRLAAVSCHVGMSDVEAKWDAALVASVPRGTYASVASLKALAARLEAVGHKARDAGIRFGYHNHNTEFVPVEGSVPYEIFLSETDPKLVDFEMDIYWITQAGGDPLAYFAKHPGRFRLIHAKDSSGPPNQEMRDVGSGVIDWKKIFGQRAQAGIEKVFVEHDEPKDPWKSIAASYKYLHDLTF